MLQGEPPRLLSQRSLDVSRQGAAELQRLASEAQQEIGVIASLCHLAPVKESARSILLGKLSVLWADLEDTRPEKLRRYGAVDSEAITALGPHLDRLISLVLTMQAELAR